MKMTAQQIEEEILEQSNGRAFRKRVRRAVNPKHENDRIMKR